jgi:hypothetical protein
MDFLSTLAGNLPFLIVVIAGLLSLLKKFNTPAGTQQKKPGQPRQVNRMPTFGGGPGEMKKTVRKAAPNPWEADHELKRRQEELDREQEEWRREERAEAERVARREEEDTSRGALAASGAGREKPASKRTSPFQSTNTGRKTGSRMILTSDPDEIGGSETAAHTAGSWTPEGEDLAKAVVWSEILGAPRSKRPYGR